MKKRLKIKKAVSFTETAIIIYSHSMVAGGLLDIS